MSGHYLWIGQHFDKLYFYKKIIDKRIVVIKIYEEKYLLIFDLILRAIHKNLMLCIGDSVLKTVVISCNFSFAITIYWLKCFDLELYREGQSTRGKCVLYLMHMLVLIKEIQIVWRFNRNIDVLYLLFILYSSRARFCETATGVVKMW